MGRMGACVVTARPSGEGGTGGISCTICGSAASRGFSTGATGPVLWYCQQHGSYVTPPDARSEPTPGGIEAKARPYDHSIPWNCPTYWDGCNCAERLERAEAALATLRERITHFCDIAQHFGMAEVLVAEVRALLDETEPTDG